MAYPTTNSPPTASTSAPIPSSSASTVSRGSADYVLDRAGHLAEALTDFFGPVAQHVLALVTFRDGLRARLRAAGVRGLPILTEGMQMVAAYLEAERGLGRLPPDTDAQLKTLMLLGSAQLAFADAEPPAFSQVRRFVAEALGMP